MSVFESDNYKMAKSEEPQSTSQYTPFEDSQFNFLNDINSGIYSSNPTLVQWDLTSIMSHNAFTSVEDLFCVIPIVMVAQYVTAAGFSYDAASHKFRFKVKSFYYFNLRLLIEFGCS